MEELMVEVEALFGVGEETGVVLAQVLAGGDQEAAGAGGGVADDVARHRRGELHHELDDVARGAELAVLAGGGDLAQHVLVDVALGVAVVHLKLVDEVDGLGEQVGRGDGKAGVAHVVRVGAAVAAHGAQEGEDMLADELVHGAGFEVFEVLPAHVRERRAARVVAQGEDVPLYRLSERDRLAVFAGLLVVQALEEEQVGDLLDDLDGIGDAAGPKAVPDAVDLIA